MSNDDFERVRGSGNVFRDMGFPEADILQAKSLLAAKIIGALARLIRQRAPERLASVV